MNGSAPNSPATGSQFDVRQKFRPNFCSDSAESFASVMPMATTMSSSAAAKTPMPMRNPRSLVRTLRLRHRDLLERRLLEHDDVGGQRRVAEVRAVLLPVGQRPLHALDHRLARGLVLRS